MTRATSLWPAEMMAHWKPGSGFWPLGAQLSPDAIASALAEAREREDPWKRCQDLAAVARHVEDREARAGILREAFSAADATADRNRIVTVSAWPLRVLLENGETDWLRRELDRLIPVILPHPNPFSRQDGLFALLFTDAPRDCFDRVLNLYCAACSEQQKTLTMRAAAEYVDTLDHFAALRVALLIREPRRRRQALRAIGEGELAARLCGGWPNPA